MDVAAIAVGAARAAGRVTAIDSPKATSNTPTVIRLLTTVRAGAAAPGAGGSGIAAFGSVGAAAGGALMLWNSRR